MTRNKRDRSTNGECQCGQEIVATLAASLYLISGSVLYSSIRLVLMFWLFFRLSIVANEIDYTIHCCNDYLDVFFHPMYRVLTSDRWRGELQAQRLTQNRKATACLTLPPPGRRPTITTLRPAITDMGVGFEYSRRLFTPQKMSRWSPRRRIRLVAPGGWERYRGCDRCSRRSRSRCRDGNRGRKPDGPAIHLVVERSLEKR